MDASDQALKDNNLRFRGLCTEARAWLAANLTKRGCNSCAQDSNVVTVLKDTATGISAEARIIISGTWGSSWSKLITGIQVKVERDHHSITYSRVTEKWQGFPWDKIIDAHLAELTNRLQKRISYNAERNTEDEMMRLAKIEVALPPDSSHYEGEYLPGYTRRRSPKGTYHIQVNCHGLTPVEACTIRDIVLAAENRKPKPQP